jgi:hypothetical protein
VVAVFLLGLIALAVLRYSDPDQPWRGGVLMTAGALTVCTPHFQWYAILLVMLVAFDGRPEWLAIAAGGYLANSAHLRIDGITLHDPRSVGYGAGALIACACALVRYGLERRARAGSAEPMPAGAGAGSAGAVRAAAGLADVASADVASADAAVEPTAVYAPAVTVTIGVNGLPSFAATDPS